ncbi:MAG: OmpH family outer membrane protein [Ferruginibacter sp.]|nr:OmpH family outer membrane protein [Ferruginibacter sp.]
MKHLSIVLNIVLIIAVGVLYYFQFSSNKPADKKIATFVPSPAGANMTRPAIAYVELDSLNAKITYIKNKRKELEREQQAIEAEWESSYKGLENQKNNFLKKGAAITQEEAQQFQGQLLQQQQQIDGKKQSLSQNLNEKSYKFMDDIQKKLKSFLEEYNKERNYMYIFTTGTGLDYMVYKDSSMNITADVIEGMNEKMRSAAKP